MPSTISIISSIISQYPQFIFQESDTFKWSPNENTIYYKSSDKNSVTLLIHELAHALMGHETYNSDIQLLSIERKAWDGAIELAKQFNCSISDEIIESNLDTYRNWLHERSTCPKCTATGMQIKKNTYSCLACSNQWKVNLAKNCGLKRRNIKK